MRRLVLFVGALTLLACGGGGVGGGGASVTEMPLAVRSAAIEKVEAKTVALFKLPLTPQERSVQMGTFLKTLPEFSTSGVSTNQGAWGKFTDGRLLVVNFNRTPEWFSGRAATPAYVPLRRPSASAGVSKSTQARLFHSFGSGFGQQQGPINTMAGWLTNAGYQVVPTIVGDARVATLRTISGDGFFYINTHGIGFELTPTQKIYSLNSSTLKTNENERLPEIANDLDTFKLVYNVATNGEKEPDGVTPSVDCRYAITNLFVDAYWNFEPNSVLFMNACYSGYAAQVDGAGPMIESCKRKGAGVYLGWTDRIDSPASENLPMYFVDRLTAANAQQKESPDQRPFFVSEIVADMHTKSLVPAGAADFVAFYKNSNVGLRPTIEYVQMFETFNSLAIVGQFGDEKGEVFIGTTPATQVQWTNDRIDCVIPRSAYGDVVVKVHGKESNKRTLTKWNVKFSYTETGPGTLKCTITANINVRQDFAKRRKSPGSALYLTDPIPFHAMTNSTCSFTATGEDRDNGGALRQAWSGGGSLQLAMDAVITAEPRWLMNGAYDPATGEIGAGLVCGGPKHITGSVGTADVLAGTAEAIRTFNTTTWTLPAYTINGNPKYSWTQWTPVNPPPANQLY